MIRARLSNGTFIMGLTRENVDRLTRGEPIDIDLRPLGGTDHVYLVFGETMAELIDELGIANGGPLPEPSPVPGGHTEH